MATSYLSQLWLLIFLIEDTSVILLFLSTICWKLLQHGEMWLTLDLVGSLAMSHRHTISDLEDAKSSHFQPTAETDDC